MLEIHLKFAMEIIVLRFLISLVVGWLLVGTFGQWWLVGGWWSVITWSVGIWMMLGDRLVGVKKTPLFRGWNSLVFLWFYAIVFFGKFTCIAIYMI